MSTLTDETLETLLQEPGVNQLYQSLLKSSGRTGAQRYLEGLKGKRGMQENALALPNTERRKDYAEAKNRSNKSFNATKASTVPRATATTEASTMAHPTTASEAETPPLTASLETLMPTQAPVETAEAAVITARKPPRSTAQMLEDFETALKPLSSRGIPFKKTQVLKQGNISPNFYGRYPQHEQRVLKAIRQLQRTTLTDCTTEQLPAEPLDLAATTETAVPNHQPEAVMAAEPEPAQVETAVQPSTTSITPHATVPFEGLTWKQMRINAAHWHDEHQRLFKAAVDLLGQADHALDHAQLYEQLLAWHQQPQNEQS